jgi:hypothetical protein
MGSKVCKDDSVILIYEREIDMTAALHHNFAYLPLLVETCNFRNNKISIKKNGNFFGVG